jgi:hypothetical protein
MCYPSTEAVAEQILAAQARWGVRRDHGLHHLSAGLTCDGGHFFS